MRTDPSLPNDRVIAVINTDQISKDRYVQVSLFTVSIRICNPLLAASSLSLLTLITSRFVEK